MAAGNLFQGQILEAPEPQRYFSIVADVKLVRAALGHCARCRDFRQPIPQFGDGSSVKKTDVTGLQKVLRRIG